MWFAIVVLVAAGLIFPRPACLLTGWFLGAITAAAAWCLLASMARWAFELRWFLAFVIAGMLAGLIVGTVAARGCR